MTYEQAYQWLHGDRIEYSGCRAAAEAMEAEIVRLRCIETAAKWALKNQDSPVSAIKHLAEALKESEDA